MLGDRDTIILVVLVVGLVLAVIGLEVLSRRPWLALVVVLGATPVYAGSTDAVWALYVDRGQGLQYVKSYSFREDCLNAANSARYGTQANNWKDGAKGSKCDYLAVPATVGQPWQGQNPTGGKPDPNAAYWACINANPVARDKNGFIIHLGKTNCDALHPSNAR